MSYTKGAWDRGELAGKFVLVVQFDRVEEAKAFVSREPSNRPLSVHEVYASAFDIDFNMQKMTMGPAVILDG